MLKNFKSDTPGRNTKWYSGFEKQLVSFLSSSTYTYSVIQESYSFLYAQENGKLLFPPKQFNVYINFIVIANKGRQPRCLSVGQWVNTQWYLHIVEYYSAVKGMKCGKHNMDESQMPYAEPRTPDSKRYIIYDFIYVTFWKRQSSRDREQISGGQGAGDDRWVGL